MKGQLKKTIAQAISATALPLPLKLIIGKVLDPMSEEDLLKWLTDAYRVLYVLCESPALMEIWERRGVKPHDAIAVLYKVIGESTDSREDGKR